MTCWTNRIPAFSGVTAPLIVILLARFCCSAQGASPTGFVTSGLAASETKC
jgi:hypothetical protein